jgi:polyphosphate glucokinase
VSSILVVDVGGSHVKILASGETERRRVHSGPKLSAEEMVEVVLALAEGWRWDHVAVGVPSPVAGGRVVTDPVNLGKGWAGFDFEGAFRRPTRVVNDAAMQALGSYEGGRMLFLGLGTGLGTAFIGDGIVLPMELGHARYRKATFEEYVSEAARERLGKKRWRENVHEVIGALTTAIGPDEVVIGGGNAKHLDELPPHARLGENANAFVGGFRLWDENAAARIPD